MLLKVRRVVKAVSCPNIVAIPHCTIFSVQVLYCVVGSIFGRNRTCVL